MSPWTNECAPLFPHTHYWYEAGILKVNDNTPKQVNFGESTVEYEGSVSKRNVFQLVQTGYPIETEEKLKKKKSFRPHGLFKVLVAQSPRAALVTLITDM